MRFIQLNGYISTVEKWRPHENGLFELEGTFSFPHFDIFRNVIESGWYNL